MDNLSIPNRLTRLNGPSLKHRNLDEWSPDQSLKWFEHVNKHVNRTKADIVDVIHTIKLLSFKWPIRISVKSFNCRRSEVTACVCMQSPDNSIMKPLVACYRESVDNWLMNCSVYIQERICRGLGDNRLIVK